MSIFRTVILISVLVLFLSSASAVSASNSTGVHITVSTLPVQPTVSSGGSSGSSGGSTGGGVIVNEPLSNILNTDRKEKDLRAGLTSTYLFNLDVYKIELHPTNNEDSVMVRVDELKTISSKTPTTPNAEVYKYFNVYSGTQRITGATIYFTATGDNINLMRWDTTTKAWEDLETTKIDATHYSAQTPTFSNFVITKSSTVQQKTEQPPQSLQETQPTTSPQEPPTQTPTVTIPGFGLFGALLILFVIYRIKKGN